MKLTRDRLIEIYQDTKNICVEIPIPISEKSEGIFPCILTKKAGIITVDAHDTVSSIINYSNSGKTAVLNMANAKHKGGGVERGAMAQEECLFRCSNLFTISDEFYPMAVNELIYTKDASFVKDANYNPIEPIKVDVITIAAPNLNKEFKGNEGADYSDEAYYEAIMIQKITSMLDVAALNGCDNIILGAWGCGAFKNNPNKVVEFFNKVLEDKRTMFENVVFAVINDSNSVGNNYEIFQSKIKV